MIRKLLFVSKNTVRSSYTWNSATGILNAAQSVVLLMIIARTNSIDDAGIFSIAYAVATLGLMLGSYCMRSYQATDIIPNFPFDVYLGSRIYTCGAMIIFAVLYCLFGLVFFEYSYKKAIIVFLVCLWKTIDALEDVFHGKIQQNERLDVAAKAAFCRLSLGLIVYVVALFVFNDLIISTLCCCITSAIGLIIFTIPATREFGIIKVNMSINKVKRLLRTTFPLCLGGFLALYICNAPKYAIDVCLDEKTQACFNYIFMPVFFVNLLANFIFNPMLTDMASAKDSNNYEQFKTIVRKVMRAIFLTDLLAILVGYLIGAPVLSIVFNTNLNGFRYEICILLVGGGCYAIVGFTTVILTVLRKQKKLLPGYVVTAILAKLFAPFFVKHYFILGASIFYSGIMIILLVTFTITAILEIRSFFAY